MNRYTLDELLSVAEAAEQLGIKERRMQGADPGVRDLAAASGATGCSPGCRRGARPQSSGRGKAAT